LLSPDLSRLKRDRVTIFVQRRDLLDAFRRGERWALTAVYREYVDAVALLLRRGFRLDAKGVTIPGASDPELERELLQDVFTRAFRESARQSYDGLKPYRPYLMQIAKNLLIDSARRAGRLVLSESPHLEISPEDEVDPAPSAEDELDFRRQRAVAQQYIASLPELMQRFVRLRFEEDQAQQPVAEALGVSRRTVRKWESEVLEGLRAFLAEPGQKSPTSVGVK
jgi:RNA polymerase sigma factor (sigma-70 family)